MRVLGIVGVAIFVLGAVIVFARFATKRTGTHEFDEPAEIVAAALAYREEYQNFPRGTYDEICRALAGENPRRITFVHSAQEIGIDDRGGFLDLWGRPYAIFFNDNEVLVRSTGRDGFIDNRQAGEADDIIFSRSADALKPD